jgi:LysR family glycine cleavage system transcriptional activator
MKLPPMNALRAFEAVSRHLSVSKAADELCVSQGAVSQQIRNLEDHLGREMFVRTPNSFSLSEEGAAFAVVVQRALAEVASAADEVTRTKTRRTLTISISQGIAVKWLMPRLGDFYETFPDVSVALDETPNLVTFKNDGVDAAVRSGNGKFDGLDSVLLFKPEKFAVASPAYIARHGKLESISEPGDHRLIEYHYASKEIRAQHVLWENIIPANLTDSDINYMILPDEHQALHAALQDQGIALIPNFMMEEEIEEGSIQFANDQPIPGQYSYYFVSPTDARPNSALIAFRDWLVAETGKYRSD